VSQHPAVTLLDENHPLRISEWSQSSLWLLDVDCFQRQSKDSFLFEAVRIILSKYAYARKLAHRAESFGMAVCESPTADSRYWC
jgi:hypothetical protein